MVRRPVVAGQFYPAQASQLSEMISGMVDETTEKEEVIGLVSPHAGYPYSGPVAAAAISRVKFKDTFVILGPNHTGMGKTLSIMTGGSWETPLGSIDIDAELAGQILATSKYLEDDDKAHQYEHSIEVQIPLLQYFKKDRCPNGDVFLCLKKNTQIKKLIAPALSSEEGWEKYDDEDEVKAIDVMLPKTKLPLKIVILRDLETRKKIRCFGSTDTKLTSTDILQKYRYRWLIENGLKDLVYSYFLDELYGNGPQKVEFEFYCTMVARLTYEYFLKELGGEHFHHQDGNKTTLQKMRNLFFEKRNFALEQDSKDNFVLTILDAPGNDLELRVVSMLEERMAQGKNKVLWWGNKGLVLRFKNQYGPQ